MHKKVISRTKIDWCTHVWNPVWGCDNSCPYCYARELANRFGKQVALNEYNYGIQEYEVAENPERLTELKLKLSNFQPTLLLANFDKRFPAESSIIFVNSMSDIGFWWDFAIQSVFIKIENSPEHIFVFLTKKYDAYSKIANKRKIPENVVCGFTATNNNQYDEAFTEAKRLKEKGQHTMISIEPIHEYIENDCYDAFDWVIVGAETGNRKGKIIPEEEWILMIEYNCGSPLFEKGSLKNIMEYDLVQQYPEDFIISKKCNKCGKMPTLFKNHHGWYVICKKGCNGENISGVRIFDSRRDAIIWWNTTGHIGKYDFRGKRGVNYGTKKGNKKIHSFIC